MLRKMVEYTDLNGNERKKECCFNISETEATKMQYSIDGTLTEKLKRIVKANNQPELMKFFDEFILMSYGEITPDGGFDKSPAVVEKFKQSEAYNKIFMELVTDANAAAAFVNAVIPKVPEEELKRAQKEFMEETGLSIDIPEETTSQDAPALSVVADNNV